MYVAAVAAGVTAYPACPVWYAAALVALFVRNRYIKIITTRDMWLARRMFRARSRDGDGRRPGKPAAPGETLDGRQSLAARVMAAVPVGSFGRRAVVENAMVSYRRRGRARSRPRIHARLNTSYLAI